MQSADGRGFDLGCRQHRNSRHGDYNAVEDLRCSATVSYTHLKATAATQHGKWRKYYGLTNSKTPEEKAARAEEKEAAKAKAAEERKAKAEAKAVEKAAKEQAKKDNAEVAQAASEGAKAAIDAAGPDVSIEAEKVD